MSAAKLLAERDALLALVRDVRAATKSGALLLTRDPALRARGLFLFGRMDEVLGAPAEPAEAPKGRVGR